MNSTQKKSIQVLFVVAILILSACSKDADNLTFVPASIESINPQSGPGDTVVTITGSAFNEDINTISVFFNNQEAVVTSATATAITAVVPRGADTGTVRVVSNGDEAVGPEFTYVITPSQVTTLFRSEINGDMDGPIAEASFASLWGLLVDTEGNLFVADWGNNKIRKIDTNGIVSTVAGMTGITGDIDGTLEEATFSDPRGIAMDSNGNIVVVDLDTQKIRRINLTEGTVETIAGTGDVGLVNGAGDIAQFGRPLGITVDSANNIYVTERLNATIRKITPNNVVSSLAGTGMNGFEDGPPETALISFAAGMAIDLNGDIVFADAANHSIRKVTPQGIVSTIAGTGISGDVNGAGDVAQFFAPTDVAIDSEGYIYVADGNNKIKKIDQDGMVTTFAGTGEIGFMDGIPSIATFDGPRNIFIDENDFIFISTFDAIRIINPEF